MKILFISSGNSKDGISPLVMNQGESLKRLGVEVEFFTITGCGLSGYLKAVGKLRNYLRNNHYDLLHAHYGLSAITALLGKKRANPLVVSFMGDDLMGSNRPDGSVKLVSRILASLNAFLSAAVYSHSIVKSAVMNHRLKGRGTIIPNGINPVLFYPIEKENARAELDLPAEETVVIFVSNPHRPEKNYTLAKASVSLLKDENAVLYALYNKPQSGINLWMNAADVLVLPSFHEGSPNVVKEAMACNCPVVSTDVGDVKEVIGDTEGCFIGGYEPKDFSEKLQKAIHFCQNQGRTKGCEKIQLLGLDEENVAKKIIALYKEVLDSKA